MSVLTIYLVNIFTFLNQNMTPAQKVNRKLEKMAIPDKSPLMAVEDV